SFRLNSDEMTALLMTSIIGTSGECRLSYKFANLKTFDESRHPGALMAACCGDRRRTERQRGMHPLQAGSERDRHCCGRWPDRADAFRSYLSVAATHCPTGAGEQVVNGRITVESADHCLN